MRGIRATATIAVALLGATCAAAADLLRPAFQHPWVVPPAFSWTGVYLGVDVGYAFDTNARITTAGNDPATIATVLNGTRVASVPFGHEGFAAGGHGGYNYQIGRAVVGIEADAMYTDLRRTQSFTGAPTAGGLLATSAFRSELGFLGTVRGRAGLAFDRLLLFGTGGLAYGDSTNSALFFLPQAGGGTAAIGYGGCRCSIQTGWTGGGGVEYALTGQIGPYADSAIVVRAEALYYDLGRQSYPVGPATAATLGTSYTARADQNGIVARAGLSFKLGTY